MYLVTFYQFKHSMFLLILIFYLFILIVMLLQALLQITFVNVKIDI